MEGGGGVRGAERVLDQDLEEKFGSVGGLTARSLSCLVMKESRRTGRLQIIKILAAALRRACLYRSLRRFYSVGTLI